MNDRKQHEFIIEQALISSITASVTLRQKGFYKTANELEIDYPTYNRTKMVFRREFAAAIFAAVATVTAAPSAKREEQLVNEITNVKKRLNRTKGNLLAESQPTFGVAQKALNLALKYLWCYGLVPEPPHCPVDSQILQKVKWAGNSWPMFTKTDYKNAIELIQERARSESKTISEWELSEWKPALQINLARSSYLTIH